MQCLCRSSLIRGAFEEDPSLDSRHVFPPSSLACHICNILDVGLFLSWDATEDQQAFPLGAHDNHVGILSLLLMATSSLLPLSQPMLMWVPVKLLDGLDHSPFWTMSHMNFEELLRHLSLLKSSSAWAAFAVRLERCCRPFLHKYACMGK